jgi:hypothetical protein
MKCALKSTLRELICSTFCWTGTIPVCQITENEAHEHDIGLLVVDDFYRGADKSLARPGRKQATATEDFDFHISIYNRNWRNISTIYIYNKIFIKRNILTIK